MSGPRHGWIRRFVHDFEHNPRAQFRFHSAMMRFWEANLIVGIVILAFFPRLWIAIGVFYVFCLSLYANWDTDLDALAASLAAQHAEDVLEHLEEETDEVESEVEAIATEG